MKSIRIAARKPKVNPTPVFPALFQDTVTEDIALATSSFRGVVVHSTGRPDGWKLGHQFDDSTCWDNSSRWKRLNEPVTIKFQP